MGSFLRSAPLLLPLVGIVSGILLYDFCGTAYAMAMTVPLFILFLLSKRQRLIIAAGCMLCFELVCGLRQSSDELPDGIGSDTMLAGEIVETKMLERGILAKVSLRGAILKSGIAVEMPGTKIIAIIPDDNSMLSGDEILIRKWSCFKNERIILPGDYDFEKTKRRDNAAATIYVRSNDIKKLECHSTFRRWLTEQREKLIDRILLTGIEPSTAHFLIAVIAGNTDFIGEPTRNLFVSAGMVHVLALSGAHVALLTMILSFFFMPLRLAGSRIAITILLIVCLWSYAAITGFSYSVTRAVLMATTVGLSTLINRSVTPFNSLCLAAILILLFSPNAIFSYSFLLSFCSVASILLVIPVATPVAGKSRKLYFLIISLLMPVAAVTGSAPIVISQFKVFAPYFLLMAIPGQLLITAIMAGGIILTALSYFGIRWEFGCDIVSYLYGLFEDMMSAIGGLPLSTVEFSHVSPATTFMLAAVSICLILLVRRQKRVYAIALFLAIGGLALTITTDRRYVLPDAHYVLNENKTTFHIYNHGDTLEIRNLDPDHAKQEANIARFKRNHRGFIKNNNFKTIQ